MITATNGRASGLTTLPAELVCMVFQHMGPLDGLNFLRTCHSIHHRGWRGVYKSAFVELGSFVFDRACYVNSVDVVDYLWRLDTTVMTQTAPASYPSDWYRTTPLHLCLLGSNDHL